MLKYYFLLRGQGHSIPALDVLNSTAKRGESDRTEEAVRPRRSNRALAATIMATVEVGKVALRSTVAGVRDRGAHGR